MEKTKGPKGVFIFIDDDIQEHIRFKAELKKICGNEVVSAYNGEEALELLKKNKDNIFLIISDIGMPKINGLELKHMVESTPELKIKAIPFIFHSTNDSPIIIKEAYSMGIQGFIKKSADPTQSVQNLEIIVKFWSSIAHPNSIEN